MAKRRSSRRCSGEDCRDERGSGPPPAQQSWEEVPSATGPVEHRDGSRLSVRGRLRQLRRLACAICSRALRRASWPTIGFHAAAAVVGLVASGLCFREFVGSRGGLIAGDFGDARLSVALLEHWYNVYRGLDDWLSPPYFFPIRHVLGYSVTLFLQSLPYASFRLAGCDPYVASELTLWVLAQVGYASMIGLLRSLGFRRGFAILGALLFTFSNLLHSRVLPQAYTVMFVPLCCWCMVKGARAGARQAASSPAWWCAAGVLLSMILFSDVYTGWFLIFFAIIASAITLLIQGPVARRALELVGGNWRSILCLGAAAALALVPFVVTYGPAIAAGQTRSYAEVMRNTMTFGDLFNVGTRNVAWGWLMGRLDPRYSNAGWDYGLPPGLLVAFAASCGLLCSGAQRLARRRGEPRAVLLAASAASVFAAWFLLCKTESGSLWRLVWRFVPGAAAIRLTFRFQYQLSLAVVVVVIAALSTAWDAVIARGGWSGGAARRVALAAIVAAGIGLSIEQVNLTRTHHIHRREELARVASIPSPGPRCQSFYIRESSPAKPLNAISLQIDAMLIAERLTLPTANGYSGFNPPGWRLENPAAPEYAALVNRWSAAHGLSHVCALSLPDRRWLESPPGRVIPSPDSPWMKRDIVLRLPVRR
jgi:hypothetical protein